MSLLRRLLLLLSIGAGAIGCDRQVAGGKADGAAVFAEVCARCHGGGGQPSPSMKAQLGVRDLTAREFKARVSDELVARQVERGSDNKLMPAFAGELTVEQIAAVAAYVVALPASD